MPHLFLSGRTFSDFTIIVAGLLTYPFSVSPSQPSQRPVACVKPNFTGITAAGTVPDSHRIPLHCDNGVITITTKFRRKGITFFPTHQISQRLNNLKTISEKPVESTGKCEIRENIDLFEKT